MKQHKFRIIHSEEDGDIVYRIVDLTDTAFVGIIEVLDDDDEYDREVRADYIKEIKANKGLRARIVGYGIFVAFDEDNTEWVPVKERDYLLSVLRQMAKHFETEVVKKEPQMFDFSRVAHSQGRRVTTKLINAPKEESQQSKWLIGWRLTVLITLGVIIIGLLIALIVIVYGRQI